MATTTTSRRRVSFGLTALALVAALTGCARHPDPVSTLKADKPHQARAAAACSSHAGRRYLIATMDTTLGGVRAHMRKVMGGSPAGQQELATLSGRPDNLYTALCLLQYPAAALVKMHLPASFGPMTLGILDDGTSFWVDPGSNS
jgi:hypothetical protein